MDTAASTPSLLFILAQVPVWVRAILALGWQQSRAQSVNRGRLSILTRAHA